MTEPSLSCLKTAKAVARRGGGAWCESVVYVFRYSTALRLKLKKFFAILLKYSWCFDLMQNHTSTKISEMAFQSLLISKLSGGAWPQISLETFPFGTWIGVSCLLHETNPLLPTLMTLPWALPRVVFLFIKGEKISIFHLIVFRCLVH